MDELVLHGVPVQERSLAAGHQARQVHAKALETEHVAERSLFAPGHP
jgi:hypothetical protein